MKEVLIPSFFLSLLGLFNIFGINRNLALTQVLFIAIGFIIFFVLKKIGRYFFSNNYGVFYWLFIFFLFLTFVLGIEVKGSRRWIDFYFFNFQSSEIFKAFFILFFSNYLLRDFRKDNPVKTFLSSLFFFLLPTLMIFKQPDLGNAAVYFFIYITMLLFSKLPKKYILYFCLILILTLPIGWSIMKSYQKDRIISFFNPHIDTQGTAYNMTQAIITAGSGKFTGRGLGFGTQSRLLFLPENHTDFAYASLVEQFGFLGGFTVLILYLVIIALVVKQIGKYYYSKDVLERRNFLYLIGFLAFFVSQILVNISMNLGLFPITGIALPFISYGGSSLVSVMIAIALIP